MEVVVISVSLLWSGRLAGSSFLSFLCILEDVLCRCCTCTLEWLLRGGLAGSMGEQKIEFYCWSASFSLWTGPSYFKVSLQFLSTMISKNFIN